MLPLYLGQQGQTGQTDRLRQRVGIGKRRSLTGPTLHVALPSSRLMGSAEARPANQPLAMLLWHRNPLKEAAHFGETQWKISQVTQPFFSHARWRTMESTACANSANVIKRYQARYARTSY